MAFSGTDSSSDDDLEGSPSRVAEQLRTLQTLVPNINQRDERSILEDTRKYLRRIQKETGQIERELSQSSTSGESERPRIIRVETEKVAERRFAVKIVWRRGAGIAGRVQQVIECLDIQMISVVINETKPEEMLSTAFVKEKSWPSL
ncbi:transcription factor FER-LIKE IRON DEFICIENCY-INDUCED TRANSCRIPTION FACTOR-like isoform X2 [Aristolochia californica]|uniref:transcription factor FER-LIKE IRON DEFICIENCY-INDUCED TRANSCRIPTION FACTOR-like isoform X2 n=1 Tax=Aristolochia californica TaxID=171875 RepID=UPI0035D8AD21